MPCTVESPTDELLMMKVFFAYFPFMVEALFVKSRSPKLT